MNSLGINKSNKETKVVVAMSGGVDSSVVAALMKQEGYNVTGITLKLYDDTKKSKEGRQCCAGQDIMDAKRVSEKINIHHEILYYQKKFRSEVIDSFIDSYAAGETPIAGINRDALVNGLRDHGHKAASALLHRDDLAIEIKARTSGGDLVMCLGAGDITNWAANLPDELEKLGGAE